MTSRPATSVGTGGRCARESVRELWTGRGGRAKWPGKIRGGGRRKGGEEGGSAKPRQGNEWGKKWKNWWLLPLGGREEDREGRGLIKRGMEGGKNRAQEAIAKEVEGEGGGKSVYVCGGNACFLEGARKCTVLGERDKRGER